MDTILKNIITDFRSVYHRLEIYIDQMNTQEDDDHNLQDSLQDALDEIDNALDELERAE